MGEDGDIAVTKQIDINLQMLPFLIASGLLPVIVLGMVAEKYNSVKGHER